MTVIIDEALNGWIVTVFNDKGRHQVVYETLTAAQTYSDFILDEYQTKRLQEVQAHASIL